MTHARLQRQQGDNPCWESGRNKVKPLGFNPRGRNNDDYLPKHSNLAVCPKANGTRSLK